MDVRPEWSRHDVVRLLKGTDNVGVELGVAAGGFSAEMIRSGRFAKFIGIDIYGDHHDTREYKEALRRVGVLQSYSLLRLTFDDALDLFQDNSLDFVYVDGYASTGEEGGKTIFDWYKKVKLGGVIAGDDYDSTDWPLVVAAVDEFGRQSALEIVLTGVTEGDCTYSRYRSWAALKTHERELHLPAALARRGRQERAKLVGPLPNVRRVIGPWTPRFVKGFYRRLFL